jgi:signal transduction histidine kinase
VDAPRVTGQWDPFLLERALSTLLDNAIKYGLGKPIRIQLQVNAEHVRLTVEDHGIGIASHDHARIFGRFERAVSGRSYGGLGLGLYTCRTILDAMGGAIAVESELGRGAKFIVDLPMRQTD